MLNTFSSYFTKIRQFFHSVDEARLPYKRTLDELNEDEEPHTKEPYKPLYNKRMRHSTDEPFPPPARTLHFMSTSRLDFPKRASLAVIREDEEPVKDVKFLKTQKATNAKEPTSTEPSQYSQSRSQKTEAVPNTAATTTMLPRRNTVLRHGRQGGDCDEMLKIQQKSSTREKSECWPRNSLRRANYSSVNKKPLSVIPAKWRPVTITESFRIEEKLQYRQLLQNWTINSSLPPSQSTCRESSASSNSTRIETKQSRKENKSSEEQNTWQSPHRTYRAKAPLSDITMRKEFRNSKTVNDEEIGRSDSSSVDDEEAHILGHLARKSQPATKKTTSVPLVDISQSDYESCESIIDSDSDSVEIVDEFPHGVRKNNLLKDLYNRKWMNVMHERHSSIYQRTDAENRRDEDFERASPLQIFQDKVESRLKYLEVICASTDKFEPSVISKKKPLFPPLTPKMQADIEDALAPYPSSEVLIHRFHISITRHSLATLDGLNWLNDEVINFYMSLIMDRSIKNKELPRIYVFSTFFYPKLVQGEQKCVSRWTKKVDIFSYDILLVPIHLDVHWCMATVDFKQKRISYYDSMLGDNTECLECIKKYLEAEHFDKKKIPYRTAGWKLENMKNIPEQMNGSDCGVFSCMFAEYKSRRAPLDFRQEDMPYIRQRMVYEIIQGDLLN